MKNKNQDVWVGVEQLTNDPAYNEVTKQEFKELPVVDDLASDKTLETGASRRDFLKYLGFSLGAATVAASCDIPLKRAIPYVVKPDAIVPGVATYYASSFVQGGDYCSVLVKTREGRPIKIEGNSLSKVTQGGTSARAQASVLSLYDTNRFQHPGSMADGQLSKMSWEDLDKEVMGKLNPNSNIAIVANTVMSPTTMKAVADFQASYPNAKLVQYDPVSSAALLDANEETLGQRAVPDYHFDKADVILSFGADFLGTWVSPIEYAKGYAQNRRIESVEKAKMSRHIQVESYLSLTGSNADNRVLIKPSEMGAAIVTLYNELASLNGQGGVSGPKVNAKAAAALKKVAGELNDAKGRSLVVCGSNNKGEQILVNAINNMLSNYGQTITFQHASMQRKGSDQAVQQLIKDMNAGAVDAVMVMGSNPAFDLPNAQAFAEGLAKVGLTVSFSGMPNETTALCQYVAPTHHYLESWGDVEVKRGHYSLIQPTIYPLFKTRQAEESLLTWAQSDALNTESEQAYFDYVKAHWEEALFPQQTNFATFQAFWDSALHDGVFVADVPETTVAFAADANAAAAKVTKPAGEGMEIALFETVNLGSGAYADNPWLMEMPDPVARTVWGNYLAIPLEAYEGGNSLNAFKNLNGRELYGEADKVKVKVGDVEHTVTCVRQFGQPRTSVAMALGYGRKVSGQSGKNVGANVYPWLSMDADGYTQYYASQVAISDKVDTEDMFACVQYHHGMGIKEEDPETGEVINVDEKTAMTIAEGYQGGITNRSVIFKGTLGEMEDLLHTIEHRREEAAHLNDATLYPYEEYTEKYYSQGHHWGMHVDLNACIGCGACQVACIAENNVPVVGKTEVARHHEMTWLRIDRYFFGDYESPNVVYQPMMCQHCDNAPCENVCPVAATNHSGEGLNQMTYNRCIGTRYCANNCPYKVRRFNWLDYTTADLFPANEVPINGEEVPFGADNLTRMVLNPDVTVRSRGVIEKCSFCVQRIQEGKLTAKREQRRLRDADVKTACQTACPTGAITFGDRNNKNGELNKLIGSPLNYRVLEETNTQSSVLYSAKVVNRDESLES